MLENTDSDMSCIGCNNDKIASGNGLSSEYRNQLFSFLSNILNSNQNSLSSLDIRYIAYFYSMFPLHINSFNTLFRDVINPKLQKLTTSVTGFTAMTCEISKFITSLRGVSGYLNVNPPDELLKLIQSFDGNTYLTPVKSDIDNLITELQSKIKYDQIIEHVLSLARPYNQRLSTKFKIFKNKIGEHNKSLEENIKCYIDNINKSLEEHRSCVQELINKICENVKNLCRNKGKLGQFIKYKRKEQLFKYNAEFQLTVTTHFQKIFETHKEYKQCLTQCYSEITTKLNELKHYLQIYLFYICQSIKFIKKYNCGINDSNIIDPILDALEDFKPYVNEFDNYIECVKKLEEIGELISTMKNSLNEVRDKVDDKAVKYINGLEEISINSDQVETEIRQIKGMNDNIIAMLKIARHTIDFYKSLENEIKNLTHTYYYHNNIDYLIKDYSIVKGKLESFEKQINQAINKIKEEIKVVTTNEFSEYYKNLLQYIYISDIPNIKSFIGNSLQVINVIKYLLPKLQDIKKDLPDINYIKSKVCEIKELKGATTNLTEARDQLNKFLQLQESTKSLIDTFNIHPKFTSIGQYSNKLDDIINESKSVIGYVNYYSDYLTTIGYVDNLINCIKGYKTRFETIKEIIQNFKGNVKEIITRLETINKNICLMKPLSCRTSVEYNLWILKVYMNKLKVYITDIRNDFNVITGVIDQIKKESWNFGRYRLELESLEKYINYNKNNNVLKQGVVKNLGEIKNKIKEILIVIKYIIDFHSHPKCINEIEGKLICVESNVRELECAIEGVAGNFLFESGMRINRTSMVVTRPHGHKVV